MLVFFLRSIQDKLSDRKSPYETRFGTPFDGPMIPFGAEIDFTPISRKDNSPSSVGHKDASWHDHRIRG